MTAATTEEPAPEGQQWICEPALPCACNPANPDACDCDVAPDIARKCSKCGNSMILISVDTGDPI